MNDGAAMREPEDGESEERRVVDAPATPIAGSYIAVAERAGASYFDLGEAWDRLTPLQRTAANQHFLDVIIGRRERVQLSVDPWRIEPDSFTAAEVRYLRKHGYVWADERTLAPPPDPASQ
jgi:hypothetical protein